MRFLACALLALATSARAQSESEKLSAGAEKAFNLTIEKPIAPRRSATGFFLFPVDGKGNAGGVDVDLRVNGFGGSAVLGLSGFGRTIETGNSGVRQGGKLTRVDVKAFDGGPTVGYRQRLFAVGLGRTKIVPNVALGWAPLSVYKVGHLDLQDNGRYKHIDTSGGWAPATAYASAGVNVSLGARCSVGLEARGYRDFLEPEAVLPMAGFSLTYTPR